MVFVWRDYCFASEDLTGMDIRLTETSLVSVEGPWMLDNSSEGNVVGASAALNVVAVDQRRY